MRPQRRRHGTAPDREDPRDLYFRVPEHLRDALPRRVDLRPGCPPVYDQGRLNACSANAIAAAFEFEFRRQGGERFRPSRLFLYYNERAREGEIDENSTVSLRSSYKAAARLGICPERMWPYVRSRFAERPPRRCYLEARDCRALHYLRLRAGNLNHLRACLAEGYPFVFGITVFESFLGKEAERRGKVPWPSYAEQPAGGHALMGVGYDDFEACFLVRNSYGRRWGMEGYCELSYAFFLRPELTFDFWTLRRAGE